ncbi:MAG: ACT domain-containing protein [Nitrososphaerales archaeon]|nr:ACT domain-containing protein [Nitrososphaerales archaeon]
MIARSAGIAAPSGRDVYEIYVVAKSRPGVLGEISGLLGQRSVDILQAHVQVSKDGGLGYIILYVEMADSKTTVNELLDELRKKGFVTEVKAESRNSIFFETMMFPLTSGGHYRIFAVGANEWLKLIDSLKASLGTAAGSILFQEGSAAGGSVVENIGKRFQGMDKSTFVENFRAFFSASGLGLLGEIGEGGAIEITIDKPAVTRKDGAVLDDFLIGVVAGALGKINSRKYAVRDPRWSDENRLLFLLVAED